MKDFHYFAGHLLRIAELYEFSPAVGQKLRRRPIRSGDDCFTGADCERQRAAGQLLLVQIGCDIDVGCAQEVVKLTVIDESVVEDHMFLQI
jgi:hypothetical protein